MATVDVDRQEPQDVVGQGSMRAEGSDIEPFISTQLKLIQSDAVLRPVTLKYNLLRAEGQVAANSRNPAIQEAPIALKRLIIYRPP